MKSMVHLLFHLSSFEENSSIFWFLIMVSHYNFDGIENLHNFRITQKILKPRSDKLIGLDCDN